MSLEGWTQLATVLTFMVLIYQVYRARRETSQNQRRERKLSTYAAYNEIRDAMLRTMYSSLNNLQAEQIRNIDPTDPLYIDVIVMLSRIERMAAAVVEGIFDFWTIANISRTSLTELHAKMQMFIIGRRAEIPEYCLHFSRLHVQLVEANLVSRLFLERRRLTTGEVAAATGLDFGRAAAILSGMVGNGQLARDGYGGYRAEVL